MFKIWYMTMTILNFFLLFYAATMMQGFVCETILKDKYNYSPYRGLK